MSKILVLNGPNLNLLGTREPAVYGHTTLDDVRTLCEGAGQRLGLALDFRQSNHEGVLIDWIHEAIDEGAGILINPAGLSFRSIPLLDALKMFPGPIVEFHISNIHKREPIYHRSLMSPVVTTVIAGLGAGGYPVAIDAMRRLLIAA
ncbi:MAG: 3-dehydroquinate dehydratase [Proteobacteria bacterium]|nr:3-dehydroquinate dehydratase [Pseudomonadota bacterium]